MACVWRQRSWAEYHLQASDTKEAVLLLDIKEPMHSLILGADLSSAPDRSAESSAQFLLAVGRNGLLIQLTVNQSNTQGIDDSY